MPRAKKTPQPAKNELEELTAKVVSCAMKIHRVLGPGFNLSVYKHSLAFEMTKMGIAYNRDKELAVLYEGVKTGNITVDFLIDDKIIVELTTQPALEEAKAPHESLLHAVKASAGLLLNFGTGKLEFVNTYHSNK